MKLFKERTQNFDNMNQYDLVKRTKRENFRYLNETKALPDQTVLFGDSITEIFNWYELFYDFSKASGQAVYNRGISGDTTNRLLERLYDNALNITPKNLVILIGTNDLGNGAPIEYPLGNIEKLIMEINKTCPNTNIILEAVYPVNKKMNTTALGMVGRRSNETIKELNFELKKIADKYRCIWLDLTDKLADSKGNLNSLYCYDGLHLNAKGFTVVAENIIPLLK
ncbi:MAG: hypothetical protein J1F23_01240 [Oscillospiraceae bacterium]|nr:hypothetical protein [Oscillospiraceae bacterium]